MPKTVTCLEITAVKDHHSIRINDRVQSVGDRKNSAVAKLFSDRNLNQTVRSLFKKKQNCR